jgi:diguanylate cyclase (GGDEF)-like protein
MKAVLARQSFGRKLWLVNLSTTALAGLLAALLLGGYGWVSLRSVLIRSSETLAHVLAQNAAFGIRFDDAHHASETLSALLGSQEVLSADLILNNGRRLAHYQRPGSREGLAPQSDAVGPSFSENQLRVMVPVDMQGGAVGFLHLSIDMLSIYERLGLFMLVVMVISLVVLVLVGRLQSRLLRQMLLPVTALVQDMRHIGATADYSQRTEILSQDEIGELGMSFNAVMALIEERDQAIGRELSERRRAEAQLEHLALHDPVTGLPNRHYLLLRAQPYASDAAGLCMAVLYFDLDNFKQVNDNFGHACGDRLLAALAKRLRLLVRGDNLLMRFGGDEFVIRLHRLNSERDAVLVARDLLALMAEPLLVDGHAFVVRASIGIAMVPQHGTDMGELLQKADAAMYVAKNNGKNDLQLWHPGIAQQASERFNLEADLRMALDSEQIGVEFQPIVRLIDGRVIGMEALVRWQHPQRGPIAPADFIPVAEDSGLILPLGLLVLETACTQVAQWQGEFGPLFLAVNVSARQFRDPDFVRSVSAVCQRLQFPMAQLELEVTESIVMHDTQYATRVMAELVELGLHLALDDFGTGYSSLSYLKRFPVSKLKIDRSFVNDLPHDSEDLAIVKAILALAHSLQIGVVAEGIEAQEQAEALLAMGCDYGQGFHYSRALDAAQFSRLLLAQQGSA